MPAFGGLMTSPAMRCPSPFAFPFNPLGLGLFDADPSRILALLHHQTLLAEEALRHRGTIPKDHLRFNPFIDMFSKEHELFLKRNAFLRNPFRNSLNFQNFANLSRDSNEDVIRNRSMYSTPTLNLDKKEPTVQKIYSNEDHDDRLSKSPPTKSYESPLSKDTQRLSATTISSSETITISKEKSPTSSTSSSPTLLKSSQDNLFLSETIEEETKCVVCNATFPSVWLLEQHAALQHANSGGPDEKPFICEQCGQTYRYRSAYVKHREQNHRARLPADKLFTCDVCGMQFRYLKSFKKHRLNHALERLHGKNEKRAMETGAEQVSSSNEAGAEEVTELRFGIKTEEEEEYQDDTVDSPTAMNVDRPFTGDDGMPKISSSNTTNSNVTVCEKGNFILKQPRFMQTNEPESSIPSTSVNSLITAERIPSEQILGLNPQEASILNFLRVDAAEKQRDRRFACPFCGKCVRSKENLKLHVRKHTGERPFVCLFCGRAFGGKSDLTRHLRIHTGERPYHCEACGKCFARADYLSKHLTTHVHNSPR